MPQTFAQGYAVVVGVGADLAVTVDDAIGVADLLRDPGRCAYPSKQVRLLTDEQATASSILLALDWLAESTTSDSTAIVYYSGHGLETPDYYLMSYGYDIGDLPGTAIPGATFTDKLQGITAKKLLVLLDCCHAGGQAEAKGLPGVKSPLPPSAAKQLARGSGRVVIASSRKDEESWTGKPYSVFTGALLEGLAGYGAFEQDGYARVLDIIMHVGRMVPERSGDRQHPIVKVSNLEDNFALAYYAGGEDRPKSLDWASSVPAVSVELDASQVEAWRRMLVNRRRAMMLMEERMSEYIEYQAIPLQLIDNHRRTKEQIADLQGKLGLGM